MLEKYYSRYEKAPDFIAEGLSIAIIENALRVMQKKGISRADLAREMGVPSPKYPGFSTRRPT